MTILQCQTWSFGPCNAAFGCHVNSQVPCLYLQAQGTKLGFELHCCRFCSLMTHKVPLYHLFLKDLLHLTAPQPRYNGCHDAELAGISEHACLC